MSCGVSRSIRPKSRWALDHASLSPPPILSKLRLTWGQRPQESSHDNAMMWAACCLAFFGFLRLGELTVPSDGSFDPMVHLTVKDISFDDATRPTVLHVTLKQSKTDPFRKGVTLTLGRTNHSLCPVAAMAGYLVLHESRGGPLFQFEDGRFLTRQRMVRQVQGALQEAGMDASSYNGHSFRIGAATTAALKGMEDAMIKTLGRWESTAYLRYVQLPREQLAAYTQILIS